MSDKHFFTLNDFVQTPGEKPLKHTFLQSHRLLVGINVLKKGQAQSLHEHAEQDKFYYVVEGSGRFTVGATTQTCTPGGLILAPAGVPHGVVNEGEALLVFLTGIAPFA